MPVKLFGPKVKFTGKTLWEIVGNLKDFGVGRLVCKSHFFDYPEPSYYKIVKVQPVEAPENKYTHRKVMVWAEHVFRGRKYSNLVQMHYQTHKTMFQLIPKSEEYKFLENNFKQQGAEISPYREWPPVMEILLGKELEKKGKTLPRLQTVIQSSEKNSAVINEKLPPVPYRQPNLYNDVSVEELQKQLEHLKSSMAEKTATAT